jgi:hypothetical protein
MHHKKPYKKARRTVVRPAYTSKSYRAYLRRLHTKYPTERMIAESFYAASNRRGFIRRILQPLEVEPVYSTPVTDAYKADRRPYRRGIDFDLLLADVVPVRMRPLRWMGAILQTSSKGAYA